MSLLTLADQIGFCVGVLAPIFERLQARVFSGKRIHGDDTVLARGETDTGRCRV